MPQPICSGLALEYRGACEESLTHHFFEIRIRGEPFRHLKFRERVCYTLDLYITAVRNRHGAGDGVRQLPEDLRHFLCSLEVKLIRCELHALAIAHRFAGLDAHE